jgi:predicted kinase
VVTGPPASGKTTVGRLLAGHFSRGVHLEADVFRRNIVSGRAEMTPDASPEALEQLLLRYRLGAVCADAYFEAGFTVVLEDVIGASCSPRRSRSYRAGRFGSWSSFRSQRF